MRRPSAVALASLAFLVASCLATSVAAAERTVPDGARVVALALPAAGTSEARPVELDVIDAAGEIWRLELTPRSLRAPGFTFRAHADGVTRFVEPPPPSSVVGAVIGREGSLAAGSIGPRGAKLVVDLGADGGTFVVRPLADFQPDAARDLHVVTPGSDWPEDLGCGVGGGATSAGTAAPPDALSEGAPETLGEHARTLPRDPLGGDPRPAGCGPGWLQRTEIAFDVDEPYYQRQGADLAATLANVEGHLAAVDAFYTRDVLITYELTDVLVRETPFYMPGSGTGDLLVLFRDEWRANQADVPRDIAHLMTGQPAPGLAGLAYVAVTCATPWHYGWSVDSSGVLGHELGHNWSSGHCHDTSPCNAMCGACLLITPNTKRIIESFRDSRGCLEQVGPAVEPQPPYAMPDSATLTRAQAIARTPLVLDVLANDHDANCDERTLVSFDAVTPKGGRVELVPASGPDEEETLRYTPPCLPFAGVDTFGYVLGDGTGLESATTVEIDVADRTTLAAWALDDGTGVVGTDDTGRADLALSGDVAWTDPPPGSTGSALLFAGTDDGAVSPALGGRGASATIALRVRRDGPQSAFAGLAFTRDGGAAGLHVGTADELRYHWNAGAAAWDWDSGLVLPDGEWAFAALVVEPDQATLYLDDGTGLRSATNVATHPPGALGGALHLGRDPSDDARRFVGAIDDVVVLDFALTPEEVEALAAGGGRAFAPRPADGAELTALPSILSWRSGEEATSHDVYLGRDAALVAAAEPGSPLHLATTDSNELPIDPLDAETTWAWRVDVTSPTGVARGDTWIFETPAADRELAAWWSLDESGGTSARDGVSGLDCVLRGDPTWVAGRDGGALALDGAGDLAECPPLTGLDGSTVSITLWLRRDGDQSDWAGLVFRRDAETTAGFNLGPDNDLRYHWGGGGGNWGFASGLVVPDATWVLAALVVGPDAATLHLHDGTLQSATNAIGHRAQDFAAPFEIGRDPTGGRLFRGELDEIRIWNRLLSPEEIDALHRLGAPASNPLPGDGARVGAAPPELSWLPGAASASHRLYVGADRSAVESATPASPEYRGELDDPRWPLDPDAIPAPGAVTWWRVDQVTPSGIVPGRTWGFRLADRLTTSLRVERATDARRLTWRELGGGTAYEVLRCDATAGPCAPEVLTTVGPRASEHEDAGAAPPRTWYRVLALGGCEP